jgi:hypothetical protein
MLGYIVKSNMDIHNDNFIVTNVVIKFTRI